MKGRAPESGDKVEGSDGTASGGGTSVAELSLDAAHLRKNRVSAGQRWEPSPLDVCPCVSGTYGSCMSHPWSGSDRRRGGGSLEVIFRGRQSPHPPPQGSGVSCPPSVRHTEGVDVWIPSQGLFLRVGCLPESGIQGAGLDAPWF